MGINAAEREYERAHCSSSLARELIRRFLVEIGPLAASPYLGVSTGYACEAVPCNRTNLNKERAKQFSGRLLERIQSYCCSNFSAIRWGLTPPGENTKEHIALVNGVFLISMDNAIAIIALRTITLMQWWQALLGVVTPAAMIMAITMVAVIWPDLQGILLTLMALTVFIAAMSLMPAVMKGDGKFWQRTPATVGAAASGDDPS